MLFLGMGFLIAVGGYCGDTFESNKASTMPFLILKIGTNREAENWAE